jgi:hypothetical protein
MPETPSAATVLREATPSIPKAFWQMPEQVSAVVPRASSEVIPEAAAAAPEAAAAPGVEATSAASEATAAPGAEATPATPEATVAPDAQPTPAEKLPLGIRMTAMAGANTVNQVVMSGANAVSQGIGIDYLRSIGAITPAQAAAQRNQAVAGVLLDIGAAPFIGAFSGALPELKSGVGNFALQLGTNGVINSGLTYGTDLLNHQGLSAADVVQIVGNSLAMSALAASGRNPNAADNPEETAVTEPAVGLSEFAKGQLGEALANWEANGAIDPGTLPTSEQVSAALDRAEAQPPDFLVGASSEAQTAFKALLGAKGQWNEHVRSAMSKYVNQELQSSDAELRSRAQTLRTALNNDPNKDVDGLPVPDSISEALGSLLAQNILVTRQAAPEAGQTQPDAAVAGTPDPGISEPSAAATTAEPTPEVAASAGSTGSDRVPIPEVRRQLARVNGDDVSSPPSASPRGAIMSMLGKARQLGGWTSYNKAVLAFAEVFKGARNTATRELPFLIETGALGRDAQGKVQPSIHGGLVGTALFIRFLRAVAKSFGVTLKPIVVTDSLNAPVVQAVNDALGVGDTRIVTAPWGSWSEEALTDLFGEKPAAVLSFGQSSAHGGAQSLIEPANELGIPTFAVGDYTDNSIGARLAEAEHPMAASMVDIGVTAFIKGLAKELGPGKGRSPIIQRPTTFALEKYMSGLDLVDKGYTTAAQHGAMSDDARFAAGASPGTISIKALVGAQNVAYQALMGAKSIDGPLADPSDASAQVPLSTYNEVFQRAQPAKRLRDQLAAMPFQISQASGWEKFRLGAGAGASLIATGFVAIRLGAHDPATVDAITALGAAATALRQFWISKVAGRERLGLIMAKAPSKGGAVPELGPIPLIGRLPVIKGLPVVERLTQVLKDSVAHDPASEADNNRRRALFNWIGAHTYPVSIITGVAQALSAGGTLHGPALYATIFADGSTAAGLAMVLTLYWRNLFTPQVRMDQKLVADPTFKPSTFLTNMVDGARIPLALGGLGNIAEFRIQRPAFTPNTIPNYARNLTSVAKAAGVWGVQRPLGLYQTLPNGQKKISKPYEYYDLLAATWPGNWDTIFASAYGELPIVHEGVAQFNSVVGE